MLDSIEPWHYFTSPIYSFKKKEFLSSAKEVVSEKFEEVKKVEKLDEIYPLFNTKNIHDDKRISDLVNYVMTMSHHILDSQGYDMTKYKMEIYDFWCQEHHRSSGHEKHVHNSIISGFYFLDCPKNSCKLLIYEPRPTKEYLQLIEKNTSDASYASNVINFIPEEGEIIFANSWLPHGFTRNESESPFRMIHFNLGVIYSPNHEVPAAAEII